MKEEDVILPVNIKAQRQHSELATPYTLFSDIFCQGYASVVMPDGIVYTGLSSGGQFSNPIAQAYAEQNNGLFFPHKWDDERLEQISLKSFLEATKILAKNPQKDFYKKLLENPKAFNDITDELAYLDTVLPKRSNSGPYFEGSLKVGDLMTANIREINLGLAPLNSFGIMGFDIVGRRLSAEIRNIDSRDAIDPTFVEAASEYARENKMRIDYADKDKTALNLAYQTPEINFMRLCINFHSRKDLEEAIKEENLLSTKEMIPTFREVAGKIGNALTKSMNANQEKQVTKKARYLESIISC